MVCRVLVKTIHPVNYKKGKQCLPNTYEFQKYINFYNEEKYAIKAYRNLSMVMNHAQLTNN